MPSKPWATFLRTLEHVKDSSSAYVTCTGQHMPFTPVQRGQVLDMYIAHDVCVILTIDDIVPCSELIYLLTNAASGSHVINVSLWICPPPPPPPHTHTHTLMHVCTHTRMHTRTTHTYAHTHTIDAHTHSHTHACMHTHTHAHTHDTHTRTHTHTHTYTHTHTQGT